MTVRGSVRDAAFEKEIAQAKALITRGELEAGFAHLERAHVIGQAFVASHARSHWQMFKLEIRRRKPIAAFGQFVRLVLGILGSAVGKVPVGNTGGSNVRMFKRMPIAPDLQDIIDDGAQHANGGVP